MTPDAPNPSIDEPVWANLRFRVLEVGVGRLPEEPGLYLFVAADLEEGWIPQYVGQTGGLRKRMRSRDSDGLPTHERWQEAARRGATYIHYRVVRSEEKRDELECRIWNDHRPPGEQEGTGWLRATRGAPRLQAKAAA